MIQTQQYSSQFFYFGQDVLFKFSPNIMYSALPSSVISGYTTPMMALHIILAMYSKDVSNRVGVENSKTSG